MTAVDEHVRARATQRKMTPAAAAADRGLPSRPIGASWPTSRAARAALEDLADSFPALLFALATGYARRASASARSSWSAAGAPLREAADALGVAWWLRKLPPQAFTAPLPALPTDPDFAFRIAEPHPARDRLAPIWLARVGHAHEACGGADYALWLARQADLVAPPEELFILMAAWAWFSGTAGLWATACCASRGTAR